MKKDKRIDKVISCLLLNAHHLALEANPVQLDIQDMKGVFVATVSIKAPNNINPLHYKFTLNKMNLMIATRDNKACLIQTRHKRQRNVRLNLKSTVFIDLEGWLSGRKHRS